MQQPYSRRLHSSAKAECLVRECREIGPTVAVRALEAVSCQRSEVIDALVAEEIVEI